MFDLTIIIPHYNTPGYLRTLLGSIPVRDNIQVIVIDDKSDKDTDVLDEIKASAEFRHITFLDNETGTKSAGACRNIGLKHAEGKWLLFADADDFFVEGFYEIVAKYFESNCDVIFFTPTSIDVDTKEPASRHIQFEEIVLAYRENQIQKNELYLRYRLNPPWSKMIRREFVESHNLRFSEIVVANDAMFSAKAGYHMKSFFATNEVIYCITTSPGSITKTVSEERYDVRLGEFIERYGFLKDKLSKREFKTLGLCAAETFLYSVIKYGFGVKKLLRVVRLLKKNKVRIITVKYLNPFFLFSGLRAEKQMYKKNKRFYVQYGQENI